MRRLLCRGLALLLLGLLLAPPAQAVVYYLSPTGSNANAGTSAGAPWQTFSFALFFLVPGDTLTLLDGTYTAATSGWPQVTCGSTAVNGTASQPITVKAQNERRAHVRSDGTLSALWVQNCAYWVFEGIHFSILDNVTNHNFDGSAIAVYTSNNLTFRRLLVQFNNRFFNSHGISLVTVASSLLEDNELYSMHRHGIAVLNGSSFNTVRRNYLHSRQRADIGGQPASIDITQGDVGITCYPCNNTIFENNIVEEWDAGYDIQGTLNPVNNRYLGSISLSNDHNVFKARSDISDGTSANMPQNTQFTNFLVVGSNPSIAMYVRSTKNTRCDNCTILDGVGATAFGFNADIDGAAVGDGYYTVFGTNMLLANNAQAGIAISGQDEAQFNHLLVFGNGGGGPPLIPPTFTNVLTVNPNLGTCKVFIPAGSPAKGAGVGGADIGANILYRYHNGTLTNVPLWEAGTGKFPCGAQVAGVNDLAGSSCFDVHQRLNVNFNGCTLPTEGPPPDPPPPGAIAFPARAPVAVGRVPGTSLFSTVPGMNQGLSHGP